MNPHTAGKTPLPKVGEIDRDWILVDAEGQTLGRLATMIAGRLMGKHKVNYTPHLETGDNIVVINAEKIVVTGAKLRQKKYYRHTGFWGGLKERDLREMLEKFPSRVIEKAVSRMLKRSTRKGRNLMDHLRVYAGASHPHGAQNPTPVKLG
jgi:large subunit ribosomal protein L13